MKVPKTPLDTITTVEPWDVVATDYTGPLNSSSEEIRYILLLTDHFSKYVEVPDQTAEVSATSQSSMILFPVG